jgi:hypothetical protein
VAYDRTLLTPLLGAFVRALFASMRRRARKRYGAWNLRCGAVTFVQRFGGALNLNVHFHTLALDGVYEVLPRAAGIRFHALPPPDSAEVARALEDTMARFLRALQARGYGIRSEPDAEDGLEAANPYLAALYAAAVQGRSATGENAGQPLVRLGLSSRASTSERSGSAAAAVLGGFSLHAGVSVAGTDRAGLERLCRYMGRPPLAAQRPERTRDGRIVYRLRHRWRDGTSAIVFEPRELLARLAAQVPPPRAHQVRCHGILAPSAQWRAFVVPRRSSEASGQEGSCSREGTRSTGSVSRARRMAWSDLLRRVFAIDALRCDRCGGRMRVMAAIRAPASVAAFLVSHAAADRTSPGAAQEVASTR